MTAVLKREMRSYFTGAIGYVFVAATMFTSALFFYVGTLAQGTTDMSMLYSYMFTIMMVLVPMLTMRLLAEEKRQKTDQLLLTSPVSLAGVVAGKFLAALIVFLLGISAILVFGASLAVVSHVAWRVILGNFTGLALLGMMLVSIGMFISSLTENQVIAAVAAIFVNMTMLVMGSAASILPSNIAPLDWLKQAIIALSAANRYGTFSIGIFSLSNLLYFLSVTALFLFLTVRSLERRRWN